MNKMVSISTNKQIDAKWHPLQFQQFKALTNAKKMKPMTQKQKGVLKLKRAVGSNNTMIHKPIHARMLS